MTRHWMPTASIPCRRSWANRQSVWGPGHTAIREKAYGIWQTYNWEDYFSYVRRTALGLLSLGIRRRENVAIVTNNQPRVAVLRTGRPGRGRCHGEPLHLIRRRRTGRGPEALPGHRGRRPGPGAGRQAARDPLEAGVRQIRRLRGPHGDAHVPQRPLAY